MATPPLTAGIVVRLLILCLIVGFLVHAFGFAPLDFWRGVRDALDWAWDHSVLVLHRAFEYIVLGAAIVLPIAVIVYGWRWLRGR
jgi:hypothetical protein